MIFPHRSQNTAYMFTLSKSRTFEFRLDHWISSGQKENYFPHGFQNAGYMYYITRVILVRDGYTNFFRRTPLCNSRFSTMIFDVQHCLKSSWTGHLSFTARLLFRKGKHVQNVTSFKPILTINYCFRNAERWKVELTELFRSYLKF